MASDRSVRAWLKERRFQALIAVLGIALAVTTYLIVDGKSALGSLIQGLSISFIFAAVAFLFANYFLYSDELEPAHVFRRIGEIVQDRGLRRTWLHAPVVDWGQFLNEPPAMSIEGFVRYLDRPMEDYHDAFVAFFLRGGKFTLVLPAGEEGVAATIAQQIDPDNPVEPERILGRIAATQGALEQIVAEASTRNHSGGRADPLVDPLTVIRSTRAPNYWALVADRQRALFSPYENSAKIGSRMPIFEFDLTIATELAGCLEQEMARFEADA